MIDKLEYLTVLAAERHFGRAAERLGITQPTLSAGLRQLEDRLGATLVNRGSRFQGMTPEGERVLVWARRITDDVRTMREEVRTTRGGLSGHLRIGVIPTALSVVADLVAPFQRRYPGVTCEITSHTSTEIATRINAFEIDVAVTYLEDEQLRRLDTRPLYTEHYCLVTKRGQPFADRENVTWDEAASLPLCLLSRSMQNRRILNAHLAGEDGFEAVLESNSVVALLTSVRVADLATILPARATSFLGLPDPLVAIPITTPPVGYEIGLAAARRDPRPPVLAAFWDECVLVEPS